MDLFEILILTNNYQVPSTFQMNWRYHLSTKQKLTASRKPFHAHAQGSFLPLDLFCFCVGAKKRISFCRGRRGEFSGIVVTTRQDQFLAKFQWKVEVYHSLGVCYFVIWGATILDSSCFRPGKIRRSKEELEKNLDNTKRKQLLNSLFAPPTVSLTDFFCKFCKASTWSPIAANRHFEDRKLMVTGCEEVFGGWWFGS